MQGTYARKGRLRTACEVYRLYSTSFGCRKDEVEKEHPEEFEACRSFIRLRGEAPPREDATQPDRG